MNQYPDAVTTIVNDYLDRVRAQLALLPALQREDFLREISSHIYEAYNQAPGENDVARILAVLRNFGEPAEVVSDRLPGAMARSGRNLPLYIIGGILVALFGIPLGAGGFGVLVGLLAALAGLLIAFYALAGSLLFTGGLLGLLGIARVIAPELWDNHVNLQFDIPALQNIPPSDQGMILVLFGSLFLAGGWGLVLLGKHLLRGLRFLFNLTFDWMRRSAKAIRLRLNLNQGSSTSVPNAPRAGTSIPVPSSTS